MNKQIEALTMAIKALQNNQTYDFEGNPMFAIEEANEKAINACKEALAEAEAEEKHPQEIIKDHWDNFKEF